MSKYNTIETSEDRVISNKYRDAIEAVRTDSGEVVYLGPLDKIKQLENAMVVHSDGD
jgi:hypothetical protein